MHTSLSPNRRRLRGRDQRSENDVATAPSTTEGPLGTVAIITTDAVGPAATLHDWMPVVFADPEAMQARLSSELRLDDVPEPLTPIAGDRITVQPANVLLSSVRNDGPELLELG